jgi:hypothetical protein
LSILTAEGLLHLPLGHNGSISQSDVTVIYSDGGNHYTAAGWFTLVLDVGLRLQISQRFSLALSLHFVG